MRRRPGGWLKLGLAVTLVLVTGFLVVDQLSDSSGADRQGDLAQVLVHSIERSDFDAFITESGDVESSDNLEIVCELEAPRGAAGTRILEVVDEGTIVKKGDFLVAFDDTALKQRLIEQ